ncbi:hypothetical protein FIC87_10595 [Eggerthella lenta]|uniref:SCP domain-containing protein n=1 Tax=Eggerthella lenta TaxID=84112 RepID=A0A5C5BT01_EGGLN|nr:cell wall-binding repeat-containing protein [Eggerthella lenta]TNU89778.1 hypothetical protein FIC87_10595 [Eggerthella lenta]
MNCARRKLNASLALSFAFVLAVLACCFSFTEKAAAGEFEPNDAETDAIASPTSDFLDRTAPNDAFSDEGFSDIAEEFELEFYANEPDGGLEGPATSDSEDEATVQATTGLVPVPVSGQAQQTSARTMLKAINGLRSSVGAKGLAWDARLENVAIQRAAELSVLFSHTRPSGESCFSAFPSSLRGACGENIAYTSYPSNASTAFDMWKNSSGHYENMVSSFYNSVGVACFRTTSGASYWVQVFSGASGSGMTGAANDSSITATVHVQDSCVSGVSVEPPSITIGLNQTASLPRVTAFFNGKSDLGYELNGYVVYPSSLLTWRMANDNVAAFTSEKTIVGVTPGKTECTVKAPSSSVLSKTFKVNVAPAYRLWGADALKTMQSIVQTGFADGSCDTVILATMGGYWDALTSSSMAGLKNCPVLLTDKSSLSAEAARQIARLNAKTVLVAGGESAISNQVVSQIKKLPSSYPQLAAAPAVKRLAGKDAVGTALAIYDEGKGSWGTTAVIATAATFQDALSMSPYSYCSKAPIFLANPFTHELDTATKNAIRSGGFTRVVIAGGTAAISSSVEKTQLKGMKVVRLGGPTAYETSVAISEWCLGQGMQVADMGIATGTSYYDAITGSALCGKRNSVLVLVDDNYPVALDSFISKHASSVTNAFVFGGPAAISNDLFSKIGIALL